MMRISDDKRDSWNLTLGEWIPLTGEREYRRRHQHRIHPAWLQFFLKIIRPQFITEQTPTTASTAIISKMLSAGQINRFLYLTGQDERQLRMQSTVLLICTRTMLWQTVPGKRIRRPRQNTKL